MEPRGIEPISAWIEDQAFWNNVDNGESFAKGDILFAELKIEQEFNKTINGHASVVLTLDTYSHVLPTMQEAASQKLEKILFG